MQVELNNHELSLLEKALDAYEKESAGDAFSSALLSVILTPREQRDAEKGRVTVAMEAAHKDTQARKRQTTLLRAKLYQAAAKESEHVIETAPLND